MCAAPSRCTSCHTLYVKRFPLIPVRANRYAVLARCRARPAPRALSLVARGHEDHAAYDVPFVTPAALARPPRAPPQVRLPDGTRHSRRFARSDRLSSLFDFVDVELDAAAKGATPSAAGGGDGAAGPQPSLKPGSYNLVTQFPRSVVSEDTSGAKTFEQAGLAGGGGAAFFVEQKGV
jgi:hypothetical protein